MLHLYNFLFYFLEMNNNTYSICVLMIEKTLHIYSECKILMALFLFQMDDSCMERSPQTVL